MQRMGTRGNNEAIGIADRGRLEALGYLPWKTGFRFSNMAFSASM